MPPPISPIPLVVFSAGPRSNICKCNVMTEHGWKLMKQLFDPYRPELHYMRGPGPKWHEKHGGAATEAHRERG
jgi:hypothetical protein